MPYTESVSRLPHFFLFILHTQLKQSSWNLLLIHLPNTSSYRTSKDPSLSQFGRPYQKATSIFWKWAKWHIFRSPYLNSHSRLFFSKLFVITFNWHSTVCCHLVKYFHCEITLVLRSTRHSKNTCPSTTTSKQAGFHLHVKLSVHLASGNKYSVL